MRWIIGDVHGMLRPLEALLKEISRVDSQSVVCFVGDYVNRGPDSRGVIDLLLTLKNARFIRGNHDDVLDQILHGVSYADNPSRGDRFLAYQWFLDHGLIQTLQSYGATYDLIYDVVRRRTRESLDVVTDLIPASHRSFIRSLPVFLDDQDLFVIHGKWPTHERASPHDLLTGTFPPAAIRHEILWGRYTAAELRRSQVWRKRGFFGHTPVQTYDHHEENHTPIVAGKMVLLDTAAALIPAGRLTAYCAESTQILQADPGGRLVASSDANK